MSDHSEQTADVARALVDQAQALAQAENYAEAFRTLQEAVAIYQRLTAAPNGVIVEAGATVSLADYQRLEAKYNSSINVLLATFPLEPNLTQQELDDIQDGKFIPFDQVLADLEKRAGDQG